MSKSKKFRLRSKPRKPKRRKVKESFSLADSDTLASVIEYFKGNDLGDVYFESERDYGYYSDDCSFSPYFTLNRTQTDEEYAKDVAAYEKRLAKYEAWYKENEEEIVAEVARRKVKAEEKARLETEKTQKRLRKQQKMLEKDLARLEKRLQK